jgi:hypothetical protein
MSEERNRLGQPIGPTVPGWRQSGHPGSLDRQRLDPGRRRLGAGDGLVRHSKSQVSKLCEDIGEWVNAFVDRPIKASGGISGSTLITSRSATVAALSPLRR